MKCKLALASILVYIAINSVEGNEGVTDGTELVFAFMVHRHGDRTPLSRDLSYSKDPEALAQILDNYGEGQLTPTGEYRGYQIGQFIRRRYSSLLSPRYNESEVYVRATDVARTKMTVLTAMAAVYPPTEDSWSRDIHWTPVPYTTENIREDFLEPFTGSCFKYLIYLLTYNPPLHQHMATLEKWSQIVGFNLTNNLLEAYTLYTDYESLHSADILLIDTLEEMWPEIQQVADAILDAVVGNEDTLPLLTGVLLNEFFNTAFTAMRPVDQAIFPRVRIYSGHDLNVYGLVAGSMIRRDHRPGPPKFGSVMSLELRRMKKTGSYVVLPVYVPDPDKSEVIYLPIEGCNRLCEINQFKLITSSIRLKKSKWKKACLYE